MTPAAHVRNHVYISTITMPSPLREPQPFLRRPLRFAGRRTTRSMQSERSRPDVTGISTFGQLAENQDRSSRAHYNRLVGALVQEEYARQIPSVWNQRETEWMSDIFDAVRDDIDIGVRSKIQDLLKSEEPPDLNLLELPDKNEN
jgi:hypothetical protein